MKMHGKQTFGALRRHEAGMRRAFAVFMAVMLTVSLFPAQGLADQEQRQGDQSQAALAQAAREAGVEVTGASEAAGANDAAAGAGTQAAANATADGAGNAADAGADADAATGDAAGSADAAANASGANTGSNAVAPAPGDNGTGDAAGSAADAGAQDDADAADAASESDESNASYHEVDGVSSVTLEGPATYSRANASEALRTVAGLDAATADEAATAAFEAFAAPRASRANDGADGSFINYLTMKWITSDTADDGDPDNLYLKPSNRDDQAVRMRLSYSLSGENNFAPGELVITVPANMFYDRDGNPIGKTVVPLPQDPSTNGEWNYKLVDGNIVITNTRQLSAATQGYIEFEVQGIDPTRMQDMEPSEPFTATIEAVTPTGTVISKESDNALTAQFDTEANMTSATKRQSGDVEVLPASSIPEAQRIDGVDHYVVVTWYMNAYISQNTNQPYELKLTDTKGDTYQGFIIDQTAGDGTASSKDVVVRPDTSSVTTGTSSYTTVKVAYPLDQFTKDNEYTFENSVTYTLTEKDPTWTDPNDPSKTDPQKVVTQTASSSVKWTYEDPVFIEPTGHFMVYKNGNSHTPYANGMETVHDTFSKTGDLSAAYSNNYYGVYPSALNSLRDGQDVDISYTVGSMGYLLPWTYEEVDSSGNPLGNLANYGHKPVTLTTEDYGLSLTDTGAFGSYDNGLKLGTDFTFKSVEFPAIPTIMKATQINLKPDGSIDFDSFSDGTVDYVRDDDVTKIPQVTLQVKQGGQWVDLATADWTTGSLNITLAAGGTQTSSTVDLPEGVEGVRTVLSSTVAGVYYAIRVNTTVLASGAMGTLAAESFDGTPNPTKSVWNYSNMTVSNDQGSELTSINKRGRDKLNGYTTDTRALLEKTASDPAGGAWNYEDGNGTYTQHYTIKLDKQSFISDQTTYEAAVADGSLTPETVGTFYDLLPKGMAPQMDTIKMRDNDIIVEAYTIENYRGTGRTMLVVKADLTPQSSTYKEGSLTYYKDTVTLEFDAKITRLELNTYGNELHNVVSYESGNDKLGTVPGYQGEEDNAWGSNNVGTKDAFASDEERDAMTDLNPNHDAPSFVYAGHTQTVDAPDAALSSLNKLVMTNNDGYWSTGVTYGGTQDTDRDVYASGTYSYRLSMKSGETSKTKDIIIYDTIENYIPNGGNDPDDIQAVGDGKIWRGTFEGIDVSGFEAAGCAPKVYYSTNYMHVDLGVINSQDGTTQIDETLLLGAPGNAGGWQLLTEATDLSTVRAIAIDAREAADGGEFTLGPNSEVSAILNMRAPQGDTASELIERDAHAYNNVVMTSTDVSASGEHESAIRHDYTKVGLVEYKLNVTKAWDDADNQDGLRPDRGVTAHLYADGKPAEDFIAGWTAADATKVLDDSNNWSATFGPLPYLNDDGSKIIYTLREDDTPAGYTPSVTFDSVSGAFTMTNVHKPEQTEVSGVKTWVGDTEGERPASIKIKLYADGKLVQTKTVRGDASGNWSYSFTGLDKYRDGGVEIVYTVEEDVTTVPSYVVSQDGFDITNTYHPFGNLVLSKKALGTTMVEDGKKFTFTVEFTKTVGSGDAAVEEPVLDEFAYVVYGADDAEVSRGTVATNGTIVLEAGQRAEILEIPQNVNYKVTEAEVPGFTTSATGNTGTIKPNEDQTASFTNTYAAESAVNLRAVKKLTGHKMSPYQFRFELVDETGAVVRTATNAVASDAPNAADGNTVQTAPVTFGALAFTQADHGKTYTYTIREVDSSRPGYTYAADVYTAKVTVTDNGDGTLGTQVEYFDAAGAPIADPTDVDAGAVFDNSYEAKGQVSLQAMKTLLGGQLTDGQFEFELGRIDVDEGAGTSTFTPVGTVVRNDADGLVNFLLDFDQRDAGKTYVYAMREVAGADATMDYDTHVSLVRVTVADNDNGTLSLSTEFEGFEVPCWESAGVDPHPADCAVCGGDGTVTAENGSYEFQNRYHDGALSVEKVIGPNSQAGSDPNQTFTFRIELTNEQGLPVDVDPSDVQVVEKASGNALAANVAAGDETDAAAGDEADAAEGGDAAASEPAEAAEPTLIDRAVDFVTSLFVPEKAYADIASGNMGTWWWTIDDSGCLTIGGTGVTTTNTSTTTCAFPWQNNLNDITSVEFEPGTTSSFNLQAMFSGCKNLKSVDFTNFNTSSVQRLRALFQGCSSLESITWGSFDTPIATNFANMFNGCTSLKSVDLSSLNTSSVTDMSYMFQNSGVTSLDLSSLETYRATSMTAMFAGCAQLTSITFGGAFETSNVTSMSDMFSGCSSLTSLDVSNFDTASVTSMTSMFEGCSSLASLDVSNFDTASVTSMTNMFFSCPSLTSLNVSSFDTAKVTSMASMFEGCSSLTSLDVSSFDTSKAFQMAYMFRNCLKLTSLDLSNFDTTGYQTMRDMFDGCSALSSVTLGPNFSFKGSNTMAQTTLPTPNTIKKTWIKEDLTGLSYTPIELADAYEAGLAGTYVWDMSIDIVFHANGGSGNMPTQKADASNDATLNLVGTQLYRPGYVFVGWSGTPDGDVLYEDGGTVPHFELAAAPNGVYDLYAQWQSLTNISTPEAGVIEVTMPAGYIATVSGLPAGTSYRVYEQSEAGWQLVDKTGDMGIIQPDDTQEAVFTNEWTPGATSAQIFATKTFDGEWAHAADGFQFQLYETTGGTEVAVGGPVTVSDGGNVVFFPIEYDAVGTHTYVIREVDGGDANINYDPREEKVTVNVSADPANSNFLVAEVVYDDSDDTPGAAAFANTTVPGSLTISKAVSGAMAGGPSADQEFSFKLTVAGRPYAGEYTVDGGAPQTTADGVITLKGGQAAHFADLPAGSSYAVSELDVPAGWTQTGATNTAGTIESRVEAAVSFTNEYAASGDVQLMAYKLLEGATAADGQFTFELFEQQPDGALGALVGTAVNGPVDSNATMPDPDDPNGAEVANPAYGKAPAYFPTISYTQAGTYTYSIREQVPANAVNADGVAYGAATPEQIAAGGFALDGVVYDTAVRTVTVTVTDNGDGTLSAVASYGADGSDNTFTNEMQTVGFSVAKVVTNDELSAAAAAREFEFTLSLKDAQGSPLLGVTGQVLDAEGLLVREVTVDDGGTLTLLGGQKAVFSGMPYGAVYEVAEAAAPGWTQDADASSNLSGVLTGDDVEVTVANTYAATGSAVLSASKRFEGGTLTDGLFSFVLKDAMADSDEFGQVLQTATNAADGSVTFKPLEFAASDLGAAGTRTFTYEIAEANTGEAGVSYDSHVVTATVTVTDNGDGTLTTEVRYDGAEDSYEFENRLAVLLARTGAAGVGLLGAVVVAVGCAWALRRRRSA